MCHTVTCYWFLTQGKNLCFKMRLSFWNNKIFGLIVDKRFVTATITNKIRFFLWSGVEGVEFVFRINFLPFFFSFLSSFPVFFLSFRLSIACLTTLPSCQDSFHVLVAWSAQMLLLGQENQVLTSESGFLLVTRDTLLVLWRELGVPVYCRYATNTNRSKVGQTRFMPS